MVLRAALLSCQHTSFSGPIVFVQRRAAWPSLTCSGLCREDILHANDSFMLRSGKIRGRVPCPRVQCFPSSLFARPEAPPGPDVPQMSGVNVETAAGPRVRRIVLLAVRVRMMVDEDVQRLMFKAECGGDGWLKNRELLCLS